MSAPARPDPARELARLKDFQRATVEHVHRRLWLDEDRTGRFLVADEVGLGKTLVARGVIAATLDHLWDTKDRLDVVYICSNAQIARQNLARLRSGAGHTDHADRLTMLPQVISQLEGRKVNFVSFTPGTSFDIGRSGGRVEERVLLYWLLVAAWGRDAVRSRRWVNFFRGGVALGVFDSRLAAFRRASISESVADRFAADVANSPGTTGGSLGEDLAACAEEFRYARTTVEHDLSRRRYRLIGRLRSLVAHAAVRALAPDLIILDEFQRFRQLLDPDAEEAGLARALFDQPSAKILLLSATPFKMYTLPDEPEGDDHYRDFMATVRFLAAGSSSTAIRPDDLSRGLRTMRNALLSGQVDAAMDARDRVETGLRKLMSRVERTGSTTDRDGMLRESTMAGVTLAPSDVAAFRSTDAIARIVDRRDIFEYWRSAPYLLNLMDAYQVKKKLRDHAGRNDPPLRTALQDASGLLDWESVRRYEALDPGNAKMRGLVHDVLGRGAWKLAWLPPSMAYYSPAGAFADAELRQFTKRLVFSAWAVVPKAIAVVLSYEAERRCSAAAIADRTYDGTRQPRCSGSSSEQAVGPPECRHSASSTHAPPSHGSAIPWS